MTKLASRFTGILTILLALLQLSGCAGPVDSQPSASDSSIIFYGRAPVGMRILNNFQCQGISAGDFERWLIPRPLGYIQNPPGLDPHYCHLVDLDYSASVVVEVTATHTSLFDDLGSGWESRFVYHFPSSFGLGGAILSSFGDPNRTEPNSHVIAYAILCSDGEHCIDACIFDGYANYLKPNVNRVIDPVGTVLAMVETAWRGSHILYPDEAPTALPDVNPSPWVPITQPVVFTPSPAPTAMPTSMSTPAGNPSTPSSGSSQSS